MSATQASFRREVHAPDRSCGGYGEQQKALIISLAGGGGLRTMRSSVTKALAEYGFEVTVASYAFFREYPELSASLLQLPKMARPGSASKFEDGEQVELVGCWLPELEYTHYRPSNEWSRLLNEHDVHICVSGAVLPTWPVVQSGRPCLAWLATPYFADKADRILTFPWHRRLVDRFVDTPLCRSLERRLLTRSKVLALSSYTRSGLEEIQPGSVRGVLPQPVDDVHLSAPNLSVRSCGPWRIGFAARYSDPRKNVALLLDAIALCRSKGCDVQLELVGDQPTVQLLEHVRNLDLAGNVGFYPTRKKERLAKWYRTLDLFIIPSRQEGLCIAGIEAMAAGCPVISTRCGGPADYVKDSETGYTVGFEAGEMGDRIVDILRDHRVQSRMRRAARYLAETDYGWDRFAARFRAMFSATYPKIALQ